LLTVAAHVCSCSGEGANRGPLGGQPFLRPGADALLCP
jgi:hypothetical protein